MEELNDIELTTVKQVLDAYANEVITKYKNALIADDKTATGNLIRSLNTNVVFRGVNINVYLNLADYWYYVEHGRKPGKFPPIDKIHAWVIQKPVIPREFDNGKLPTTNQLAYLIGRKIAREGIKPGNQLHNTLEQCNKIYLTKLQAALQADFDKFSIKILDTITNSLKKAL